MDSFIHLPEYRIVICKECKFAVVGAAIKKHLQGKHKGVTKVERLRVAREISQIPHLIQTEVELQDFQFPSPNTPPITGLTVEQNGLKCRQCSYVVCGRRNIQEHCRVEHGWENDRGKGREAFDKREERRAQNGDDLPWIQGIRCQRFFKSRSKSQYFEVGRAVAEEDRTEMSGMSRNVRRIVRAGLDRIAKKSRETIKAMDESKEPNPWLRRVGWVGHLEGKDPPRLLAAIQKPDAVKEITLATIMASFERIANAAQQTTTPAVVGRHTCFEINRKEHNSKARKPFDSQMDAETWIRYKGIWKKSLCYLFRTQTDWEPEDRPEYELTTLQENAFDALVEAVEGLREHEERRGEEGEPSPAEIEQQKKVDRGCLRLCTRLLNHPFRNSEYESAIISGLAVMGLKEDGGWANAEDYTPVYSGFIKVARMLVVQEAYQEQQDGFEMNKRTMTDKEARDHTEPIFDIVRRKVNRYMTLISDRTRPTPMDWIYESRSYGFKIRYNTTAEGVIDWVQDKIRYQKKGFTMNQVRDMIHGLVEEARRDLMELLMLEMNEEGEVEEGQLPTINWSHLEDDFSEEKVGWSFLDDIRNQWAVDGRWWLLDRVCQETKLRKEWERRGAQGQENPFRGEAIQAYQQKVERFQEKLCLAMHIVGGQPARAPELIGMRYANTKNGGIRNIFVQGGLMCFVTAYHKNYRSSEQTKIIHRFLPQEVGELLLRYLWLVLPFWQHVQIAVHQADEVSPFLWADVVDQSDEQRQGRGDEDNDHEESNGSGSQNSNRQEESSRRGSSQDGNVPEDEGYQSEENEFDFQAMHRSKKWTSERIRKILQKYSRQFIGVELNISAWRHIAIGISRRFLRGDFKDEGLGGMDADGFDEDNDEGDSPWDLQAGHGTHVAGMIYARELRQGRAGTISRRDQFRQVSQRWHRFLGFSVRGEHRPKRKLDEFEEEAREIQYQRFKRLCHVNVEAKLRGLMGKDARFRGIQKPAIDAIMTGQSIVQITGTGGGKSLSFMLPAYCVPDGVTIVIAPLVALKEDLQRRCDDLEIDSIMWDVRRPRRTASIIMVTPESAVGKQFATFVNWLSGRYQLDRVVVDECHTVLDSGPQFRPKMRQLGEILVGFGCQVIYLTATLPPRDVAEFYKSMAISARDVEIKRAPTTRKNIRYSVQDTCGESEADVVCRLVEEKAVTYPDPAKIIIYVSSITQGEELAERLNCPMYHANVDDEVGKAQRMKQWLTGQDRVIVATNALGLGVDVPDVRVVIHAGAPRKLRDYAQESGRAGRDGQASEAIIIRCRGRDEYGTRPPDGRRWVEPMTQDMPEFMSGRDCRRVVMDEVMDGRDDRAGCEEGEEMCDVCREDRRVAEEPADIDSEIYGDARPIEDDPFTDSGVVIPSSSQQAELIPSSQQNSSTAMKSSPPDFSQPMGQGSPVEREVDNSSPCVRRVNVQQEDSQLRARFEQQQRHRQWQQRAWAEYHQQEACQVAELERQLERFQGRCPLCLVHQAEEQQHAIENCTADHASVIRELSATLTKKMADEKWFDRFSCCYHCHAPQAMCQRWQQKSEQGWWEEVGGVECQFGDIVIPGVYSMLNRGGSEEVWRLNEWAATEGVDLSKDLNEVCKWFGKRVEWGGIEGSRLLQVFFILAKSYISI